MKHNASSHVTKFLGKDHHKHNRSEHVKVLMREHHAAGDRAGVPTEGPRMNHGGKCYADGGDIEVGPKPLNSLAYGGAAKVRKGIMTQKGHMIRHHHR